MIAYEEEPNYRSDAQQLYEIDPHAKAILFGSRARGTEHEGSDWDILILLDKPKVTLQDYDKYSYPLRELGWDIDETINPVLFSQKEWEENRHTLFNHNVTKEGIVI
ncbi:nucleotidyltransferase domain-containing protein [Segatella sinensis]|uniref:Nucleotidyltransferase domain-containing protein n=1 Tax=Segatella sinensis TaxID=3085167 RepID=A0ABV1G1R0_9BACT